MTRRQQDHASKARSDAVARDFVDLSRSGVRFPAERFSMQGSGCALLVVNSITPRARASGYCSQPHYNRESLQAWDVLCLLCRSGQVFRKVVFIYYTN